MKHDGLPAALLSAREAAKQLGISPRLLWTLSKSGQLPVVRISRRTMYDPNDLRAFVEASKS